jgi:1,4-alpha-glucan branching enzyme/maltooligosyltrehalose trehalohydrolase
MRLAHTMPFGAALQATGGAMFRLWAPVKARVELVIWRAHGELAIDTTADAAGWREVLVPDAVAGERYQWRVHGEDGHQAMLVPDPASRSNPDGVEAPSMLIDPQAFEWDDGWRGRPWLEAVCYELHVGTFTPEGTFDAARDRLPALAELGITCIQLMPLASFPGRFGWGYDGVLPFAPHPAYGSPDALKGFIQAAHRLGMMVMLDVVYNHFGPQGNMLSLYSPSFFTRRHQTPWGAGINFDGPEALPVRHYFIHNALYWLNEYQFDGLRFDAVHAIKDDSSPDILEELSKRVRAQCAGRHVHLVLENDFNDAARLTPGGVPGRFDAQWSGDFHHCLHTLLTGEGEGYYDEYAAKPLPMLAHALGHGFALVGAPHQCDEDTRLLHPRRACARQVPLSCVLNFLQNHDQIGNRAFGERLGNLIGEEPLRLAVAMLLLNPAQPMLFMGDEHGALTPFLYFADWRGELKQAVSQGRRKEFARFSAFQDPAVRNRIPDPCDVDTFMQSKLDWAAFQQPRSKRWQGFYTELLALRRESLLPMLPFLDTGSHRAATQGRIISVRWRFKPQDKLAPDGLNMQVNLSDTAQPASSNHEAGDELFTLGTASAGELGPWSGRWYWSGGLH